MLDILSMKPTKPVLFVYKYTEKENSLYSHKSFEFVLVK